MRKQLHDLLDQRVRSFFTTDVTDEEIERKKQLLAKRQAKLVKCEGKGVVIERKHLVPCTFVSYIVHFRFFIWQDGWMYVEEKQETREAVFERGELVSDHLVVPRLEMEQMEKKQEHHDDERVRYTYDRLAAVKYAEIWWNDYNPAFHTFPVDCTNFVSQCLYAGGIPMMGCPNKTKGWWMRKNDWSYTWTVAHAFRWYLSGSKTGIQAVEKKSPEQLSLGDVICYDFQGDGRFDHTTIVVAKDKQGMPLVNAHTSNSRMRYWSYEDSTAYTPNIQYKFFHIIDRI
ncbi:amidase domain-containing protein [uncultured Anoxybacillus sp.]|uniref:amidase domain-containing protein n=1 Tax=uncultured Anoxybacillus sp. TaxID=263860 RepID=UPI00261D9D4E|nr:amidase domain-containing protein [uncultured Anoxybacillus sp.]